MGDPQCYYTGSQKKNHIVIHGGIKQVATVSSMALLCYEMWRGNLKSTGLNKTFEASAN